MNASRWCIVGLAVGLIVGATVGSSVQGRNAIAQEHPAAPGAGRYQISTFGTGTANIYGCYIIDTATGTLWYSSGNGLPKKVVEKLP